MKKLLGVLLVLVMVFALSTKLDALTCDEAMNITQDYVRSKDANIAEQLTISNSGQEYIVKYSSYNDMKLTCSNGVIEYNEYNSQVGWSVLKFLVAAIANNRGKTSLVDYDTFTTFINGLDDFNYCENNISGRLTDDKEDIASLKIDINNFGTNTCSTTSTETTTTTNKTESNPKTGVFVPVVGISVLIVASVVCLLWISKKNIYNGL